MNQSQAGNLSAEGLAFKGLHSARDAGDEELLFALLHAAQILRNRLDQGLAEVGLSMAKHGMLKVLVDVGRPLPLSELAERQSCVRSNVTQLMDRMEADGLVRRVADPADRRSVLAEITALGVEREAAGTQVIREVRGEFSASYPAADRPALERLVRALGEAG